MLAAVCSPSTFMLEVSTRGVSRTQRGGVLCVIPGQMLYHPGDRRRGPVDVFGVTSQGVCYITLSGWYFAFSFEMPKNITGVWLSAGGVVSYEGVVS